MFEPNIYQAKVLLFCINFFYPKFYQLDKTQLTIFWSTQGSWADALGPLFDPGIESVALSMVIEVFFTSHVLALVCRVFITFDTAVPVGVGCQWVAEILGLDAIHPSLCTGLALGPLNLIRTAQVQASIRSVFGMNLSKITKKWSLLACVLWLYFVTIFPAVQCIVYSLTLYY